jgi:hypothetical protein
MQLKKISLIAPSSYQESLCEIFATQSAINQQEFYAKKGEANIAKLSEWAYIGKLAEFAVFNTIISFDKYKLVSPPDVMIYERKRKSHAADIVSDGKQIHVKSCMVKNGREISWLFSTEDKIVRTPTEEDMVALVVISLPKTFEAYFVSAIDLVGKYEKPFNPTTIAHAIYESTLIEL